MIRLVIVLPVALALTASAFVARAAEPVAPDKPAVIVCELSPGLASGCLNYAKAVDLPQGTLIRSGTLVLNEKDLADERAKAPAAMQEQLRKNAFFLAEQIFTQRLIQQLARDDAKQPAQDITKADDRALVQTFFERLTKSIQVTDQETTDFYAANKDMFGGASLESVKTQLKSFLLEQKQQQAVSQYIETLGQRMPIEVSASWAKEQALLAKDNVVDKARASGKPSLIDFGSKGCVPCDMLAPILETLKTKYSGRANVEFVSVQTEQILASRYGVQTIPVQVFFDANGGEVFRHVGFWPQDQLEKKLAEMGVK